MKTILTFCNECDRDNRQHILFLKKVISKEEDAGKNDYKVYMTIECGGCRTVSFLLREPVEDFDSSGKIEFIESHFPGNVINGIDDFNFIRDDDQEYLPDAIYSLYEEIKTAFENDSCVLAGIGLRTLVEAVCVQQKMAGRTLKEKINNLHNNGLISTTELPILDKLRQIGNQSTHQIRSFSLDKLNYALDIINHVLKSIYVLPKINKKLKIT